MFRRILSLALALCALVCATSAPFDAALASGANTYYIEVDIANQITTVYRKSNRALVRQMICSTGTGDKTPRGTFRLQQTRTSTDRKPWYYISTYHCYVKYATRIKGGILFHSIPYTDRDLSAIDQEALSQLGSKASHGCIRLRWQDAKWIAKNCPDGTTVKIFTGAAKKPALRALLLKEGYSVDCGMTYSQFLETDFTGDSSGNLGRGSTGEVVDALQDRLVGLGFFSGATTGVYDNATIVAIMRYQAAAGLTVNGVAGKALIERIMAEDDLAAEYSTLTPGVSGPLVAKYQQAMKSIGFYTGEIDGVYNDDLASALSTYCACMCVEPTEKITPELRANAYGMLKDLNKRFCPGNFIMLVLNDVEVNAKAKKEAPLYACTTSASEKLTSIPKGKSVSLIEKVGSWCRVGYGKRVGYVAASKLKITETEYVNAHWGIPADALGEADMTTDSLGTGVIELQERLRALGFFTGRSTPLYDAATAEAVEAYQSTAGLPTTGMATAAQQTAIAESDGITGIRVCLTQGMSSPAVAALQRTLGVLQYYGGACTGTFDGETAKAVRLFTRTNGLGETPIASPEVQRAIMSQYLDCEAKYGSGNYVLTITTVESRQARARAKTKLYRKASAKSKSMATLKAGDEAALVSEGATWCKLRFNGKTGYARTKDLKRFTRTWEVAVFNAPPTPNEKSIVYGDEEVPESAVPTEDEEQTGKDPQDDDTILESCEPASLESPEASAELTVEDPEETACDPTFIEIQ